jgi:hypothetical protein
MPMHGSIAFRVICSAPRPKAELAPRFGRLPLTAIDSHVTQSIMRTFHPRFLEVPLTCGRALAGVGAGLFLLFTQVSCEKTSPTASQPSTPVVTNSTVNAAPGSVVGQIIQFTPASERYRVSGWSKTEGDFAWTEGTSARLALPIPADAGPLSVKMMLRGLIKPPDLPSQPVEVYANDHKIADWQVADTAAFTAEIPAELTKSGGETLNLHLRIPKAASPKSLGMNEDGRILGVCCYSIELKHP